MAPSPTLARKLPLAPQAVALSGDRLFVVNGGGSITELDTSTGALVRVISGPTYGFRSPDALVVAGADLFVANLEAGSITELDTSTGALVRVISGPTYEFAGPRAMVLSGHHLFVVNAGGSVTEFPAD
jgi:hypothetical protein